MRMPHITSFRNEWMKKLCVFHKMVKSLHKSDRPADRSVTKIDFHKTQRNDAYGISKLMKYYVWSDNSLIIVRKTKRIPFIHYNILLLYCSFCMLADGRSIFVLLSLFCNGIFCSAKTAKLWIISHAKAYVPFEYIKFRLWWWERVRDETARNNINETDRR